MTVKANQPSTHNFLNPANFRVVINRCPNIVWFTQQINIPEISNPPAQENNPFSIIHHAGDRITFPPITFTFKVSEDLGDYLEIFRWIEALGFPEDWQQYRDLKRASQVNALESTGLFSDISVFLMDSTLRPIIEFVFHHSFPTNLGGFQLDSTNPDITYVTSTATFTYTNFTIIPVVRANCNVA
jgi:hypothetical protein